MKKNNQFLQNKQGFITRIILLIVAIFALNYFLDFDLIEWLKSPQVQEIIEPIYSFLKNIYFWLIDFIRN